MNTAADCIITPTPYHNVDALGGRAESYTMKFLKKEYSQLMTEPADTFAIKPDESNFLIWYFLIHGAEGTPYHGGCYMGLILLPPNFPFAPPEIQMISPTGRFQRRIALCLTNTSYHKETWQPSWNLDKLMQGLISFMYTQGRGLGCLNPPVPTRSIENFAAKSKNWLYKKCDIFSRVFTEEYDILDEAYKTGINDRYVLNDPIQTRERNDLVLERIGLYRNYANEIDIALSIHNRNHVQSLLCKFFSPLTTNAQVNLLEIIPAIQETIDYENDGDEYEEEEEFEFETEDEDEDEVNVQYSLLSLQSRGTI